MARTAAAPETERMGYGAAAIAVSAAMSKLDNLARLLGRIAASLEDEPDFDQTFVIGGNPAGAAVVPFRIPLTLKHVEVTLSVSAALEVAVIDGNIVLTQAQQQHGHNAGQTGPSNAIVVSGGGSVTARDYLGGSGYLTAYFTGAGAGYANIRIRSLDKSQPRSQRT